MKHNVGGGVTAELASGRRLIRFHLANQTSWVCDRDLLRAMMAKEDFDDQCGQKVSEADKAKIIEEWKRELAEERDG